ncbi:MAG TPA: ATP-dependent metallopeptidase FtsH/Yme1/Tma family protein, partial [Gemmatimonadaceae bacterium]|nr:ATP-dependent metallopeptidase FtsH/Yme1/Tma family protein [Gemmatimonadaceae bacterium]
MPMQIPNKNNPKKPTNWSKVSKQLSFWVFVILVPVAIIQFSGKGSEAAPEISYSQYKQEVERGNVEKVTIQSGRQITGDFR